MLKLFKIISSGVKLSDVKMFKKMINFVCLILFTLLSASSSETKPYRALAVIHGVLTGSDSMQIITDRIQEVRIY